MPKHESNLQQRSADCDSEHREEPAAEDLRVEVFSGPAARTILHDSLKLGNVRLG